jgi:hypothetical protein
MSVDQRQEPRAGEAPADRALPSSGAPLFRRDAPFSELIFEFIGGVVLVLGVPAVLFFAILEMGTVLGVLWMVLVVGTLVPASLRGSWDKFGKIARSIALAVRAFIVIGAVYAAFSISKVGGVLTALLLAVVVAVIWVEGSGIEWRGGHAGRRSSAIRRPPSPLVNG